MSILFGLITDEAWCRSVFYRTDGPPQEKPQTSHTGKFCVRVCLRNDLNMLNRYSYSIRHVPMYVHQISMSTSCTNIGTHVSDRHLYVCLWREFIFYNNGTTIFLIHTQENATCLKQNKIRSWDHSIAYLFTILANMNNHNQSTNQITFNLNVMNLRYHFIS